MSRFVTFEGVDGAGKSVQTNILSARLANMGFHTLTTWEPGGTDLAVEIRSRLLGGQYKAAGPDAEAVMFAAARIDHVQNRIIPALDAGKWVICDRFVDSTRVYQGLAGAAPSFVALLERAATPRMPDLTIVLDVDPETSSERVFAKKGGFDRYESDDSSVFGARRRRFLEIAHAEPVRCVVVDGSGSREEVGERVFEFVRRKFLLA